MSEEYKRKIAWTVDAMLPFIDNLPDDDARVTVAMHLAKEALFRKAMRLTDIGSPVFKETFRYYASSAIGMLTRYVEDGNFDLDRAMMLEESHGACGCIVCRLRRDVHAELKKREASKAAKTTVQ